MEIFIQIINSPMAETLPSPPPGPAGAWAEFRGIVRAQENDQTISALEYEAYPAMAEREIRRLLEEIAVRHPCLATTVIHRIGIVPVGETAVYVGVAAKHRGAAFALLAEFMDRLKQDVPIWKRRSLPAAPTAIPLPVNSLRVPPAGQPMAIPVSLAEAMAEIYERSKPLPPMPVSLEEACGRILRQPVCAPEDMPSCDRSTRDGYAILQNDAQNEFRIVDVVHAADWKPRQLQSGEAARVATGAALPCGGLCVVMQENVERKGDAIKILRRETVLNLRRRGEEAKAGEPLLQTGMRLDPGKLALLASAGCAQPLVSPRLRVLHFTTGDEIIPPGKIPQPGQVRDSNSILIRSLLQKFSGTVESAHLPEDFEKAKAEISNFKFQISNADVVLVSGGASVGEKDFTRSLLAWLRFEIVFSQVNIRPGKPLIFGTNGNRVAFGLPGNPLSHFVCFHFAVATALAKLTGESAPKFLRGRLSAPFVDAACARETLWPAQLGPAGLRPLPWASAGDVTSFATANALLRIPARCDSLESGTEVDFLPAGDMLDA
jgi:molybdopterin molybdotransferase